MMNTRSRPQLPRICSRLARFVGVAALAGCLLSCRTEPTSVPATRTPTTQPTPSVDWQNPVYPADFADPYVLPVDNAYYAYATNARHMNVQVVRSTNLRDWEPAGTNGDALPELPPWAASLAGLTWAPSVLHVDGRFILYYAARFKEWGCQCISYALSESPDGPFLDPTERPWLCLRSGGGSIDPEPFIDEYGSLYLLWKNDGNCCDLPVWLWSQPLGPDGLELLGASKRLIQYDQDWESPLIENPTMTLYGGRYHLFYSANWWESRDYVVGHAVCESAQGPCVKSGTGPVLAALGSEAGPGGASFFEDAQGDLWIAYHAWTDPLIGYPGGKRSLHLARVSFVNGEPQIWRPAKP